MKDVYNQHFYYYVFNIFSVLEVFKIRSTFDSFTDESGNYYNLGSGEVKNVS